MREVHFKGPDERRRERNTELIQKTKDGEGFVFDAEASWFPARPAIKKNPRLVAALFSNPVILLPLKQKKGPL